MCFSRVLDATDDSDKVVVALDLEPGEHDISVGDIFSNGQELRDYYSNQTVKVENGSVSLSTDFSIVLLGSTD